MKILITGILGQDGQILTELLKKNHQIFGVTHLETSENRIKNFEVKHNVKIYKKDLIHIKNCMDLIEDVQPDIIVNFAGVTNVFNPWDNQLELVNQNLIIPVNILNTIKEINQNIFFFQASSSLMFGNSGTNEICEKTNLSPIYPYGIAKAFVHNLIDEYRINLNLQCSSGIFFNHDSFFRKNKFLTKKLASFVVNIEKSESKKISLGNLDGFIDISHAYDFMSGVKLIIENKMNENYVFSSGKLVKVYDLVKLFFEFKNLDIENYVEYDKTLDRKNQTQIYGNNNKLKSLGWESKFDLKLLVKNLIEMEEKYENIIC